MNSHGVGKTSVDDPDLLASPTPSQLILIYTVFNIYAYIFITLFHTFFLMWQLEKWTQMISLKGSLQPS